MAVKIIGMIIGALIIGAGIYYWALVQHISPLRPDTTDMCFHNSYGSDSW